MGKRILKKSDSAILLIIMYFICTFFLTNCNKKSQAIQTGQYVLKIEKIQNTGLIIASWNDGGSATDAQLTAGIKINQGTQVTLVAIPDSVNYSVVWNGNIDTNTVKINMLQDQIVQLSFLPIQYTLKIEKTTLGKGTVTAFWDGGSATDMQLTTGVRVYKGELVTLMADHAPKEAVVWNGVIRSDTFKIIMDQPKTIKVNFSPI